MKRVISRTTTGVEPHARVTLHLLTDESTLGDLVGGAWLATPECGSSFTSPMKTSRKPRDYKEQGGGHRSRE